MNLFGEFFLHCGDHELAYKKTGLASQTGKQSGVHVTGFSLLHGGAIEGSPRTYLTSWGYGI